MEPIELALKDLSLQDKPNVSTTANKYNVNRSTLSRRFNNQTNPTKRATQKSQLLHPQQEKDLVIFINKKTEQGIPPTTAMVRNCAEQLAQKRPGNSWCQRFVDRHSDILSKGFLSTIDSQRKGADSKRQYELYFNLVQQKIAQYSILQSNTYNMDEKGFSLGSMNKHHRIFNRIAVDRHRIIGATEPGNREWITILATICADGTWIPPGIIFAGKAGNLQTTWVENVELGQHDASFASSPNGWTNNKLGLAWLEQIFDKHTKKKAAQGREWRLLFVDGHGSHINMSFLDWCEQHRIYVAVYPPHTTHRLQPLDVSLFSPLATYYSLNLEQFIEQTTALSNIGKRDFFELFWPAFIKAFTPDNIASGWLKAGLFPWHPDHVLDQLPVNLNPDKSENKSELSRPTSKQSSNSAALSSISIRAVRELVLEVSNQQNSAKMRQLENTIISLQDTVTLQRQKIKDLEASLKHEKKRRRRGKGLFEQIREKQGFGAMWFSPQKLQEARDLLVDKEAQKEAQQAAKSLAKEQKDQDKTRKLQETHERKQQLQEQRAEQMAAKATEKAHKEVVKNTSKADKQLNNEHQQSLKKPKRQNNLTIAPLPIPIFHNIEVESRQPNPASDRPQRIKRQPQRFNE